MDILDRRLLDKLEKKNNVKNEDIGSAILALVKQFASFQDALGKISVLEEQNKEQAAKISELEERLSALEGDSENTNPGNRNADSQRINTSDSIKKLECEAVKNNIILRNIKLHTNSKDNKESVVQTREIVNNIFENLGIDLELNGCFEAIRFGKSKFSDKDPLIKIKFWTVEGKRLFFKHLAKKNNSSKNQYVKILTASDEVPESLIKEYRQLDVRAYKIRQEHKGTKTKININWKAATIALLVKEDEDLEYRQIA